MTINKLVGIIGWPVSHSISPAMHNRAFLDCGLDDWLYLPLPVPKEPLRIKEAVLGLRALGLQGANVTVPYKEMVLPLLDRVSDMAKAIGAVNTIVIDKNNNLVGDNTDGIGFIEDLVENGISYQDMRVLVLGAGGSARAVVHGLLSNGCKSITILNRTKSKADDIVVSFSRLFPSKNISAGVLDKSRIKDVSSYQLVVNTTSIGMSAQDEMPLYEQTKFVYGQVVYDLIYNPAKTKLLHHAEAHGAQVINGLGMLVCQGAYAFEKWTGQKAPVKAMREAAIKALQSFSIK